MGTARASGVREAVEKHSGQERGLWSWNLGSNPAPPHTSCVIWPSLSCLWKVPFLQNGNNLENLPQRVAGGGGGSAERKDRVLASAVMTDGNSSMF